jgi:hypothetical protein
MFLRLLYAGLLAGSALAAQPDWQPLFDGKTFQGWTGRNGPLDGRFWTIEDGCLKTVPAEAGHDIFTERVFRDFELSLEWKVSPAGNSGVFYNLYDIPQSDRTLRWFYHPLKVTAYSLVGVWLVAAVLLLFRRRRLGAAVAVAVLLASAWYGYRYYAIWQRIQATAVGMEYQILDDDRHPDGARGPLYQAGALYDLVPIGKHVVRPVGEFNETRIVCNGNHVEHWLNGEKLLEYELGSPDLMRRIAAGKFREMDMGAKTISRIALQHHHDAVWFRNIKSREISPGS